MLDNFLAKKMLPHISKFLLHTRYFLLHILCWKTHYFRPWGSGHRVFIFLLLSFLPGGFLAHHWCLTWLAQCAARIFKIS